MTTAQNKRLAALEKAAPGRHEPITIFRVIVYKDGTRRTLGPRVVPTYPANVK